MPVNVKELIVVLALSALVFAFTSKTATQFTSADDFKRRRNIWLILSATAFLAPSFWWFLLIAAPLLHWGGKKDTNPLAFYLLLMNVIPSIQIQIPTSGIGINQLFGLDIFRVLSLTVLVPAAWQLRKSTRTAPPRSPPSMDLLLIGYGLLTVIFYVPPDLPGHIVLQNSLTNDVRDAFLFFIDAYVLYYVASRSCRTRREIADALAAFCVSCTIMAAVAVFESLRHWLLYTDLYSRWGGSRLEIAYYVRAGLLRAEASSGNPLALGFLLAIAFGFLLYLTHRRTRSFASIATFALLLLGIFVSLARGTWIGVLLIYFGYAALGPRGGSRLVKSAFIFGILGGLVFASPIGDKITANLPFLGGKVAVSSLSYRERLMNRSWELIQAHPLFGDQQAFSHMQDLRQGQGIIDVVNTYIDVTLFHGFAGLALFLGFILLALRKAYKAAKAVGASDPDLALLGASLIACIAGTLLMLADCSFILGYVTTFYCLAGIAAAYATIPELRPSAAIDARVGAVP